MFPVRTSISSAAIGEPHFTGISYPTPLSKLLELTGHAVEFDVQSGPALREAYAKGGIKGFWRERIKQYLSGPLFSPALAEYHALLGEKDKALYWLGEAVEKRQFEVVFIKTNPAFKDLRADPRFLELVRRVRPDSP
jgi:hypothetical protein